MSLIVNCTDEAINITKRCINGTNPLGTGFLIIIIVIFLFTLLIYLIDNFWIRKEVKDES